MKRLALVALLTLAIAASAEGHGRGCSTRACDIRVAHKAGKRHRQRVVRPHLAWLQRTARCESGSRWHAVSVARDRYGRPLFYGGLQFAVRSWRGVGGRGMPHRASRLEQLYRGALLLRSQGPGAWPICGRHA